MARDHVSQCAPIAMAPFFHSLRTFQADYVMVRFFFLSSVYFWNAMISTERSRVINKWRKINWRNGFHHLYHCWRWIGARPLPRISFQCLLRIYDTWVPFATSNDSLRVPLNGFVRSLGKWLTFRWLAAFLLSSVPRKKFNISLRFDVLLRFQFLKWITSIFPSLN